MARRLPQPMVTQQINHFRIGGFSVGIPIDGAPSLLIEVHRGYHDGVTLTPVDVRAHTVTGADLVVEFQKPTTGAPLYDELKDRIYTRCVADGIIPEEAVEEEPGPPPLPPLPPLPPGPPLVPQASTPPLDSTPTGVSNHHPPTDDPSVDKE